MRVILCRASCRYTGRINSAELSLGDVCILLRDGADGDGSMLVFDRKVGVNPRNWMPAGSELTTEQWRGQAEERQGLMVIEHHSRGERLEVYIEKLTLDARAPAELQTVLAKLGSESQFSELLSNDLELISDGLILLGREWRTEVGMVDILALDPDGRAVAIETKRRRATIGDAYQLRRYLNELPRDRSLTKLGVKRRLPPLGVLVAPSFARGVTEWIDDEKRASHRISWRRVSFDQLMDRQT